MDGEGSLGRAVRTFLQQEGLSPKERDSFVQRIKKSVGGDENKLVGTTVDILLNPFVLFMLAVSPVGIKQFLRSRGQMMGGLSEMGKLGRKTVEGFRALHLMGSISMNDHAATSMAVSHMENRFRKIIDRMHSLVGESRGKMIENVRQVVGRDIVDLDPTRYTGEVAKKVGMLNRMLALSEGGLFADDVGGLIQRRGVTRVASTVDEKGATVNRILPLPSKKGEAVRELKIGSKFTDKETGLEHTVVSEPIALTNLENYKKAKELLKTRNISWITTEDVVPDVDVRMPFTRDEAFARLEQEGFNRKIIEQYTLAIRKQNQFLAGKNFGKTNNDFDPILNADGTFDIDPDKVINQLMSYSETSGVRKQLSEAEKNALVELIGSPAEEIVPEWVIGGIRRGEISKTQLSSVVKNLYTAQINQSGKYMPRNVADVWTLDRGSALKQEPYDYTVINRGEDPGRDAQRVASFVQLRNTDRLILNPGDLRAVIDDMGPDFWMSSPERGAGATKLEDRIRKTQTYINDWILTNNTAATTPLDFERAMRSYTQRAIGNAIYFAEAPPDFLRKQLQDVIKSGKGPKLQNEDLRERIEPTGVSKVMSRTLSELGITPEIVERVRLGDITYASQPKFELAARTLRDQMNSLSTELTALSTGTKSFGVSSKERIRRMNSLERQIAERNKALDFVERYRQPLASVTQEPSNMSEFMRAIMSRENQPTQEFLDGIIIPRLFGGAQLNHAQTYGAMQSIRRTLKSFAESGPGKYIKENGGSVGKALHGFAETTGNKPLYVRDAADLNRNIASWGYATHLSSPLTAMYNGMQLLTWAGAQMGYPQALASLGRAYKMYSKYLAERVKMPMRLDPSERRKVWERTIPYSNWNGFDLTMVSENFLSDLDSAIFASRVHSKPSWLRHYFMDTPLALFRGFEEVNRIAVADLGVNFYGRMLKQAGKAVTMGADEVALNIQNMQGMYNFAAQPTSKPRLLSDPRTGMGFLANPLGGMLVQFPIRSLTNIAASGQAFGGTRDFGLGLIGGPTVQIPAQIADLGRTLGMGALVYEIFKNTMNVDLSPALGASTTVGLGQTIGQGFVPIPAQILYGLTTGLATRDVEEIRRQLFRTLPFGIPLSKTLGALPAIPGGGAFGLLQSQYADWKNPNLEGNIPVYRSDGTLQSFESPLNLVLRGIGFDPRKVKSPQEATKFLLANRAEIIDLKRKYKDAVLGNNMALAQQVEAEYKKRYGIPMTVKPSEWDRAVELRQGGVAERMLQTLPSDVRKQYQRTLDQPDLMTRFGLPPGSLTEADTMRQRQSVRKFNFPTPENLPVPDQPDQ
jgi:hypothetical protein